MLIHQTAIISELEDRLSETETEIDEALHQRHVDRALEAFHRLQSLRKAIALAKTYQVLELTKET